MGSPEYLLLFSGKGDYEVEVKFRGFSGRIAKTKMSAEEILKLVADNGKFYDEMFFDERLFKIYKYQIDLKKNKFTIFAEPVLHKE